MVRLRASQLVEKLASLELALLAKGLGEEAVLSLQCRIGTCHKQLGNFDEAERLYVECLAKRKLLLGELHADTLKVEGLMALLYELHPAWHGRALDLYTTVLARRTMGLGELHKDTVLIARNRGHFLYKLSRHREAVDAYVQHFHKVRMLKGIFHPDTWMSLLCICSARFFSKLPYNQHIKGEYKKAILMLVGSLLYSLVSYAYRELAG